MVTWNCYYEYGAYLRYLPRYLPNQAPYRPWSIGAGVAGAPPPKP